MKHILMLGLDDTPFTKIGRGDFVERLKKYSSLGFKISHVIHTKQKYEPIKVNQNITLYPTNSLKRFRNGMDFFNTASQVLQKEEIDFITTQDCEATGIIGFLLHWIYFTPLLVNNFTLKPLSVLNKIILKCSNKVRVESNIQKKHLTKNGVSSKKVFVAPIPINLKQFYKWKYWSEKPIVLFVGRLSPEKNVSMLLKAARKLPYIDFWVIGEGELKEQLMASSSSNVTFFGNIPHSELPDYYTQASIFVLPSKYEGIPTVIIEAMASQLPIITTKYPDAYSFVKNNHNGFIIRQNDHDQLARKIQYVCSKKLFEKYGKNSFKLIHKVYNEQTILQKIRKEWNKTKW